MQTVLWSNSNARILFSSPHHLFWTHLLQAERHFSVFSNPVNTPCLSRISVRLFPAHLYKNIRMTSFRFRSEWHLLGQPLRGGELRKLLPLERAHGALQTQTAVSCQV